MVVFLIMRNSRKNYYIYNTERKEISIFNKED